ncbi:MAG: TetR/AcrR family transcriptional regulator [Albimonas sp.]|uniref:TetR/AcrR family transcriptional regulator n=1 Tax=Albimonas sp. TaxID=1872425 RepID=UPI004055FA68|tara:strand:- start:778 stop:1386 length:609 start_codon:yes stop_codon:yes gene_type:complete
MPSWNGAVATRDEQRELKRRAALRVAARHFNRKGYQGASLDEIAEEIGVTKTALYYYFKNKEQLLFECLQLSYDCGLTARLEAEERGGTAYERLRHLYGRFAEMLMEERGAYTTEANLSALPEERREQLLDRRRQLDRYSRMLLNKAIEEGSIREIDVRITSNYFLGAVNWILRWYADDEKKSPQEIATIFLDLLFNGIARS